MINNQYNQKMIIFRRTSTKIKKTYHQKMMILSICVMNFLKSDNIAFFFFMLGIN